MRETTTIYLLSETVSPMTHMARSEGNESLVAREPVATAHGTRLIPRLSGNAIRHRCVRAPGARWLIDRLGLSGQLSLPQLNFFFHGGNLTQSTGREDLRRVADMQRLFPLLRLLGGSLPDQILTGSMYAMIGVLFCEENEARLPSFLPVGFDVDLLRPAEHFVSGYQYTRGDVSKSAADMLPEIAESDEEFKSNLMIFAGQYVMPGALFAHGFTLKNASELELGCLFHSLSLWQQSGGTVGGQAARGHGRLKTWVLGEFDQAHLVQKYIAHVNGNSGECRTWIESAFKAKPDAKPGKGKKVKEAAT